MDNELDPERLKKVLSDFWAWLEANGYYISQDDDMGYLFAIYRGSLDLIGRYVNGEGNQPTAEERSSGGNGT